MAAALEGDGSTRAGIELERRIAHLSGLERYPRRPIDLKRLSGANMKGFALLHLLDFIAEEGGPELVASWRAELPEALRPRTERAMLTSVSWVPIELHYSGIAMLTRRRSPGSARGALSVGHITATRDIGAFFRTVMKFASPATVLQLSGRFWRSHFDVSALQVVSSKAGACTLEIRQWPLPDEVSLHELAGSLVAWMEASRGKNVKLTRFELIAESSFALDATWS